MSWLNVDPQFAAINASATGTIVAAVPGKSIRVLSMDMVASAALTVKWQSHATPTDISGPQAYAANGGIVRPLNQLGWFQTLQGEALDINIAGAGTVGGNLTYAAV